MNKQVPSPFSCTATPQIPELLQRLNCSIALTTFQAGKVIFVSAKNENELVQLPRSFHKPMGLVIDGEGKKMALAAKDELILFAGDQVLAQTYPKNPGRYDIMYLPTTTLQTGQIDIHDINWTDQGLCAVNTSFSCIVRLDDYHNFTPIWQPKFISALASEDRCHLNGMAIDKGKIKFATAFGTDDRPASWRETIPGGGVIIDVESYEIVANDLALPHSPRIFDDRLYVLLSSEGKLVTIDPQSGKVETIYQRNGFARGLAKYMDYIFIGFSKLRKNSSTFGKLAFSDKAIQSGVTIIHAPTGAYVGEITYQASVDEIYDIQILPNYVRPNILNTITDEYKSALITPTTSYWGRKRD